MKVVTVAPETGTEDMLRRAEPGSEYPPGSKDADPYLGCTIDARYKVEALLGEGGMGVVYRCTHKIIGKTVAMKVLRADLARDAEVTERFLNEAKAASAIGNPHIIDISDFGQLPDGSTYFVMEYLDGRTLSSLVEGGQTVSVERAISIALQLAEGLSAAHQANIVHRDLKPDNIVLVSRGAQQDFVKILDFGIAKVSSDASRTKLTRAGAVFGTPHYMSPEQAAGAPVDQRGDIYALGVILYELVSGRVPFDAENFMGILTQHMYKAPDPLRTLAALPEPVPPGLEAIVLKCLSKRPEQRFGSMDELHAELMRLKQGLVPDAVNEMMARPGSALTPPEYFAQGHAEASSGSAHALFRRRRWPIFAALVAVGLVAGLAFALSTQRQQAAAPTLPSAEPKPQVVKAPKPEVSAVALPVSSAPIEPTEPKRVVLAIAPLDAHVFVGERDLGTSPVVIEIEPGSVVEAQIKRKGYKSQVLELDGKEDRLSVKLEREARAAAARRKKATSSPRKAPTRPKKPSSAIGGNEIINPWE